MDELILWLKEFYATNQIASGGTAIVILSSAAYVLRSVPNLIYRGLYRRLVLIVEVLDTDETFVWLSTWLSEHSSATKFTRLSAVSTRSGVVSTASGGNVPSVKDFNDRPMPTPQSVRVLADHREDKRRMVPVVKYIPGLGKHLVKHDGHWYVVSHVRSEASAPLARRMELFNIATMLWNRKGVSSLLHAGRDLTRPLNSDDTHICVATQYSAWDPVSSVPCRAVESVILPDDLTNKVVEDVNRFMDRKAWYGYRGIPWRRGYLIHGPAGSGKTSLIRAVAGATGMDLGIISMSDAGMGDVTLIKLFGSAHNTIVVLEDIDEFVEREKSAEQPNTLTLAGLTNAIDGIASANGRIVMMTTTKLDKVDPALIRSGRTDVKIELGWATAEQIRRMAERIISDSAKRSAAIERLLLDKQSGNLSTADVQRVLIEYDTNGLFKESRCGEEKEEDNKGKTQAETRD